MPVPVRWEVCNRTWYFESERTPRELERMIHTEKDEVYVVHPADGGKVRVRRCKPVPRRIAWRVMVEMQCARGNEVAGGVIVGEHAEIYDHIADRWVSMPEIARGECAFTDGVRLAARRCMCDMYELELDESVPMKIEGQMRMPLGKLAVSELPEEMRRAFDSYRLFTLQATQTCPATPLPKGCPSKSSLIGVMPLRAHDSREERMLNMRLYWLLRYKVYIGLRGFYAAEAYLLPAEKVWAPYGALAICMKLFEPEHPRDFAKHDLRPMIRQMKEEKLTRALYLISMDENEDNIQQCTYYIDSSAARIKGKDLLSLYKRRLRAIFTEPLDYTGSTHDNMLKDAIDKSRSIVKVKKYRHIFTPNKINAALRMPRKESGLQREDG